MSHLVTGEFSSRVEAEDAISDLLRVGVPREEIYIEREMVPSLAEIGTGDVVANAEVERRAAGLQAGALVGLVFGMMGGLALATMSEVLHLLGDPQMPASIVMSWPFNSFLVSGLFCSTLGLLVGGALGFTIDWTLTRLGAGPAKPSEECLLTVSADDSFIEKVKTVLFRHRARHVLRA
jgi:hypothetical protein